MRKWLVFVLKIVNFLESSTLFYINILRFCPILWQYMANYNNLKSIAIYVSISIIDCYINIWQYGNSF